MIEFGYCINDTQVAIDKEKGDIVIRMHEIFLEEESYFSVLAYLKMIGIHWTRKDLKKILGNEIYRGNEEVPRLLSDEIIDQAIQIKESKSLENAKKHLPKSKLIYIGPVKKE